MQTSELGVVARAQGAETGISTRTMQNRVLDGRWQRRYRGVYLTFSGEPTREAELWAALLRAGPGAVLSHQTAAERHGLLDRPSDLIHVTVPAERHPARYQQIPGVVIHRSTALERTRHPVMMPPCTRIEDTVLDLIAASKRFDEAYGWICRAIGRRRTAADRLLATLAARRKFRWRQEVQTALGDAAGGILSWLERRYAHDVEHAHGMAKASRQARLVQGTSSAYLDNLYEAYHVCVELDGAAAHPADEQWRDKHRDNWNLVWENTVTLRFGYLDLRTQSACCATALTVASLLQSRGPSPSHPCPMPGCPLAFLQDHGPLKPNTGTNGP